MTRTTLFSRARDGAERAYLIAEIGINHGGDYGLACKTIEAAAKAGADAVKFQSFKADEFMADKELLYAYESGGRVVSESMYAMFKRLELPASWHEKLQRYAHAHGVEFLSSAADAASASLLAHLCVPAIKLASEDLINIPLLRHVNALGLPTLLSTGMAEAFEIERALAELSSVEIMLLHCVSLYPTPPDQANVSRITALKARFGLPVGYSDHTLGVDAAVAAVALGARCVEKHFTLDRALSGPDHAFSSPPEEFALLRERIDACLLRLGDGAIAPGEMERAARLDFRRSVVAARRLEKGTVLAESDLKLQRPHTGLHPYEMEKIAGKTLRVAIEAGGQLAWDMVE